MISLYDDDLGRADLAHLAGGGGVLDAITGTDGDDSLTGTADRDVIRGLKGDDTIFGGDGKDDLRGGAGNDSLTGGDQADKLSGGGGNDYLDGGAGGDTLDGGAGDDTIVGSQSKDLILGGDGDDLIGGDVGVDTIDGGAGIDTMDYSHSSYPVFLDLSVKDANGDAMVTGVDVVIGGMWAYNVITGNDEAQLITCGRNEDRLDGRGGDDTLHGGDRNDTLTGGAGADTFLYETGRESPVNIPDTITDLSKEDRIDLSAFGLDFVIVDAFTDSGAAEITLHWDEATNITTLMADGDGDGRADFALILDGRHDHFTGFVF